MFKEIDADRSGTIDVDEFVTYFRKLAKERVRDILEAAIAAAVKDDDDDDDDDDEEEEEEENIDDDDDGGKENAAAGKKRPLGDAQTRRPAEPVLPRRCVRTEPRRGGGASPAAARVEVGRPPPREARDANARRLNDAKRRRVGRR